MPPQGSGSSIRDRARSRSLSAVDPQDGLFDKTWDDDGLVAALEERERIKEQRADVNAEFKRADSAAKDKIAAYSLAIGEVARAGRFRIKKTARGGNSVSFETQPREQLAIGVIAEAD